MGSEEFVGEEVDSDSQKVILEENLLVFEMAQYFAFLQCTVSLLPFLSPTPLLNQTLNHVYLEMYYIAWNGNFIFGNIFTTIA